MGFGEVAQTKSSINTQIRFGSDYLKLSDDHRTIIRILDDTPETFWSHFVPPKHNAFPDANKGKGISVNCPGRKNNCPVCAWNDTQEKEDQLRARKLYAFNALDRTPIITCPSCGAEHYDRVGSGYATMCDCGESLKDIEPAPRNKVKILQKGIRIVEQLIAFEEEYGNVTSYDIKFDTKGRGQDSATTCIPKPQSALDLDEVLGAGWEEQKYDIKKTVEPLELDKMNRILQGEGYFDVVGRG